MSDEISKEEKTQEPTTDVEDRQPGEKEGLNEVPDSHQQTDNPESDINDQIKALQIENSHLKDSMLRAQAEIQNVRQRAQKDVEKARKYGLEKFINELLPVADNLERALDSVDKDNNIQKSVVEGVELTLKSLQDTLEKFGVEPIDPQGEPFDPQRHQAMSMAPNPDVEPNTVLDVFQKGYALHGRLVRPAMVVVSSSARDTHN